MANQQILDHELNKDRAEAKWAAIVNDQLFPLPRRKLAARDILDQAGVGKEFVLVRDHDNPNDAVLGDETIVDLAQGNVFRTMPRCETEPQRPCSAAPKLAFVCDDAWEITLNGKQTGHSLKRLLGLPDDAELLRDFESPHDKIIRDDQAVLHSDGPVFTARRVSLTVKVNNHPVHFKERNVTAFELKKTAIAQNVKIDIDSVVYRVKPDGSLGPAIRDEEKIVLHECDSFSCVAPDDKS
jgi:hypothetical protein